MKKIFISMLFACFAFYLFGQVPQSINYQAIARDASNNPIVGAPIGVRFQILQGSSSGTSVYSEIYSTTTNQVGLFNLAIGNGTPTSGTFASIDWSNFPYFLEVAIDPLGGINYQVVGSSEMHSVPYALRSSCNCSMIMDGDGDTFIEVIPSYTTPHIDDDEIHMHLGLTPGSLVPVSPSRTTKALVLRLNALNPNGRNTMLELFDLTGGANTFVGEKAGGNNTFIPANTPPNLNNFAVGIDNTALGYNALGANTTGRDNTAIGTESLRLNNTGYYNTANGYNSLNNNKIGNFNTGFGYRALFYNDGISNTSTGANSMLFYSSGNNNTANGVKALQGNSQWALNIGSDNTAIGFESLFSNTAGDKNTSIGMKALYNNINRSFNTAVGYAADVDINNASNITNSTAIGANAIVTTPNSMILGDPNVSVGIGISGRTAGPQNSLEIDASQSLNPNESGLRFTRYNSNIFSPITPIVPIGPALPSLLSVDLNGDVILVDVNSLVGIGGPIDWHVGGNAIVNPNLEYIGTNSANPLVFKTSQISLVPTHSGIIDPQGQVFFGYEAGLNNTIQSNTGIGYQALKANGSTGAENTAMGYKALTNNGPGALTGDQAKYNTAFGSKALFSNTVGKDNTAVGSGALYSNLNDNNTAIGTGALYDNNSGTANTATGINSMRLNQDGSYNTSNGAFSLQSNISGYLNVAIGAGSLSTNMTGNNNTATGVDALNKNIGGSMNTATGWQALNNNTVDGNTANGVNALQMNTIGTGNVAVGLNALQSNTTAQDNTAVGVNALKSNSTVGMEVGELNTATGKDALTSNTFGGGNSAFGAKSLRGNVTGGANTAVGVEANAISNGSYNAAIGYHALFFNNGSKNTAIGYAADVVANVTNATAIGYTAQATASNQIRLGNDLVEEVLPGIHCQVKLGNMSTRWKEIWSCNPLNTTSDFRLKTDIINSHYGIAQVMELRPVQYKWKASPDGQPMLGFIAQEVESIVPESVVVPKNEDEYYAMKYDALIPVLTKAIQEQQAQIEELKSQNAELKDLKESNQSLQAQIDALQNQMQTLLATTEKILMESERSVKQINK